MAIADEFIARHSANKLVEWTNADDPNATSTNTTILGYACTDAQAKFKTVCGIAFDILDPQHVEAIIPCIRAYLLYYMDQGAGEKAIEAWADGRGKATARVTGRDRVAPRSSSLLQPSIEGARGVVRPSFDGPAFADVNLDNPSMGNDDGPLGGD